MPSVPSVALSSASISTLAPTLVDARWLAEHLDRVRVIDTRPSSDYLDGHVPGACSFPLDALLVEDTSPEALGRLARAAQAALAARGIAPGDHVVLVDDSDGSAALGAVVCELAGMERVSVMHGAMSAWRRTGGELHTQPTMPDAIAEAWEHTAAALERTASFEDVMLAITTGSAVVLDARSQLEHEGIVGAPCCAHRGAIPGSVHLEWTACFDMAGTPHDATRMAQIASHLGVEPHQPIIVTCHAGHRAALAATVLRSAGFADVRVSLGSWHEWSARTTE